MTHARAPLDPHVRHVPNGGGILVLLLVASLLLYLAIKGIRTGRVGTRRSGYTEEESFVRFWITICAYFFLAVMMFVGLLVAVFAP